ncbi:hypothetical protein GDO86_018862 [Hymenochirus boettgeri]|uniref:C2H2-type domain-containing protein n=1 Tax=Hymenochirus boettgeri TaxID=247094 RepID=A0A8T2IHV2_9PIPI|nr:hypothetical protein GDO86_018862 [Hymenochirus boettgeri]
MESSAGPLTDRGFLDIKPKRTEIKLEEEEPESTDHLDPMESSAGPLTDKENRFSNRESLFSKMSIKSEHQNNQGPESNGSPNTLGTAKEILYPRDQMVGENSHHYTECGEKFNTKILQSSHQQTKKPFSCTECEKTFSSKVNLISRQISNTGEKPFACTECGN